MITCCGGYTTRDRKGSDDNVERSDDDGIITESKSNRATYKNLLKPFTSFSEDAKREDNGRRRRLNSFEPRLWVEGSLFLGGDSAGL